MEDAENILREMIVDKSNMGFGNDLGALRISLNMSQEKFAASLLLSRATVAKIENTVKKVAELSDDVLTHLYFFLSFLLAAKTDSVTDKLAQNLNDAVRNEITQRIKTSIMEIENDKNQ